MGFVYQVQIDPQPTYLHDRGGEEALKAVGGSTASH